jgi:hypothetical protein
MAEITDILAEDVKVAARWPQRQKQQLEQRRFTGSRWSGEEIEVAWADRKTYVPEDFRAVAISEPDILKP